MQERAKNKKNGKNCTCCRTAPFTRVAGPTISSGCGSSHLHKQDLSTSTPAAAKKTGHKNFQNRGTRPEALVKPVAGLDIGRGSLCKGCVSPIAALGSLVNIVHVYPNGRSCLGFTFNFILLNSVHLGTLREGRERERMYAQVQIELCLFLCVSVCVRVCASMPAFVCVSVFLRYLHLDFSFSLSETFFFDSFVLFYCNK